MAELLRTVNIGQPDDGSDHLNNLDPTDLKILLALIRDPRIQVGELGDSLGVARNTAQTRGD